MLDCEEHIEDPSTEALQSHLIVELVGCRPFVEPTGLDHDDGIDGLSTERSIVLRRKGQHVGGIPLFAMAQMQKDKNQQMLNVRDIPPCYCIYSRVLSFSPG